MSIFILHAFWVEMGTKASGHWQHLLRETECWHHPSRTPASCLYAALLWKPLTRAASLLIFFGNTRCGKVQAVPGVTSESGSLMPLFLPPLFFWHPPPVCLSSPSETLKLICIVSDTVTNFKGLFTAPAEPALKISNNFAGNLKMGALQNLHVLVCYYSRGDFPRTISC